jgi:antitoxin MazE
MEAKIKKWGNSFGVRIPISIIKDLSLRDGSIVEIEEEGDRIIIHPSTKKNLSSLLSQITEENLHTETDWGESEGNEFW